MGAQGRSKPPTPRRGRRVRIVGEIPGRLEKVFYRRFGQGVSPAMRGAYQHAFKTGAKILALSDGSLLIRPARKGRKLWISLPG